MGTDELHVIGDWRVFPEGRGVTEVKVKDTYTAGTDTNETEGEGEVVPQKNLDFGKFGARGIKGSDAAAHLDELAGGIATR